MPRQFVLECMVDLPDDAFDQTDIIAQMKAPWQQLTAALEAAGVKFQSKTEISEARIKPGPRVGTKRGRTSKVTNPLSSTFSPAEAAE